MKVGFYVATLAVAVCFVKTSGGVKVYDFTNSSMNQHIEAGSLVEFTCKAKDPHQIAVLKIANETTAEAKGEARKDIKVERKHNRKTAACIVKDAEGKVVQEATARLNVWFPPVLSNQKMRHHYKLMEGHSGHVSIHFLSNPTINGRSVRLIGPKGKNAHNFNVVHVMHHHRTTDHFVIITFHETKHTDFGNYSLIVTSNHFPSKPLTQNFTIADNEVHAAEVGNGGVVAAIVIGSLLTIGLVALMVFLIMRSKKRQPLPEARRPIVTEEGMDDDVFTENRPGSSRIESVDHSVM